MGSALLERYDDRIAGVPSCYDRVVIAGTLLTVCYAGGMTKFLNASQVRIVDYARFAEPLRELVRELVREKAASLSAQAWIVIEHIGKKHIRKESVLSVKAEQVATFLGRKITPQLAQEIGSHFTTRIEGTPA